MKLFIALATLAFAANVQAQGLSCNVPVEGRSPSVTLDIEVQSDSQVDFVILSLTEASGPSILFTQLQAGEFAAGLAAGQVGMLVLEEEFAQEEGVIRGSGVFMISKEQDGSFSGLLSAKGNVYPIQCAVK